MLINKYIFSVISWGFKFFGMEMFLIWDNFWGMWVVVCFISFFLFCDMGLDGDDEFLVIGECIFIFLILEMLVKIIFVFIICL